MSDVQEQQAEIERDRRSERRLIWQALVAIAVVVVLVVLREWLSR
ncbi:hypothetical protein GCM10009846_16110 [Agrococcus versicolor]|uniref:Uncharacterized protein n=1 Tax=Agrococcus versicolor TaxID=501482 RepID=A0ABP5MG93_9MICO